MTLRIAHRGAAGYEPENTLRSLDRAIALQADLVEFDIQRTRDGHLVLLHDKRVDRTTNGHGRLSEMTLAEVRTLDAGKGEKVPTLEEVLELTTGRIGLMPEIITPGIAAQVCRLIRDRFQGPVVYASFLHAEMAVVRSSLPDAETLALIEAVPISPVAFARQAQVTHVGLSIDSVTAAFVNALKADGLKVFGYTADDPRDIALLRDLGVDGIISNYPDRL
jgi:glycerophosphoryl diester phosphodiesterase